MNIMMMIAGSSNTAFDHYTLSMVYITSNFCVYKLQSEHDKVIAMGDNKYRTSNQIFFY